MFVDRAEIYVEAGKGGDGCIAFRREKHVPFGGPNGGDGGNGGNIVFRREGVNSLVAFAHRKHWRAPKGEHGKGSNRHGKSGEHMVVDVPPGTLIADAESGLIIKDLVDDGDEVIVARGGRGGKGNPHFKSSTNQARGEKLLRVEPANRGHLVLELKVIADVGLLGKPNAGKSTLLSRISRARPEIADYPFTTKFPNLGLVTADINRSFVIADIPGLIEGAADGVGLGHDFLRHITRAGILVHLVEPEPLDGTNPIDNYRTIRDELQHYGQDLAERPEILVVSKSELPAAHSVSEQLSQESGQDVLLISAVTGEGLNQLIRRIAHVLDSTQDSAKEA